MKRAISCAALAAALATTAPLPAQQPVQPGAGHSPGGPVTVRPSGPGKPGGPQIQPPRPGTGGPQIQPPKPGPGGPIVVRPGPGQPGGPQIQPPRPGPGQPGGPQIQPPRPGSGGPQIQPPRPGPNRPSPPGYRPGYWNDSQYRYPQGYNYHRYAVGSYLPRAYWSNSYWRVNDWRLWGLPSFQSGYRWYRVGQDALLVNTRTGRIAAVRHDVFW